MVLQICKASMGPGETVSPRVHPRPAINVNGIVAGRAHANLLAGSCTRATGKSSLGRSSNNTVVTPASLTQPSRKRYSPEELKCIALLEIEHGLEYPEAANAFICYNLLYRFGFYRSAEGLRKKRLSPEYQRVLATMRRNLREASLHSPTAINATGGQEQRASTRMEIKSALRALLSSEDGISKGVGEGEVEEILTDSLDLQLDDICRKAIDGRRLEVMSDLEIFIESWKGEPKAHSLAETLEDDGKYVSKRNLRKIEYRHLQKLFKKNRKKAAQKILRGPTSGKKPYEIPEFAKHWSQSLASKTTGVSGLSSMKKRSEPSEEMKKIWSPVERYELRDVLNSMPDGKAPGPDNVSVRDIKGRGITFILKLVNLIMYIRKVPNNLKISNTVFLAKTDFPESPSDFRPISLCPILLRVMNKILAKRLAKAVSLDYRQRAFQPGLDGCAENIVVLEAVLKEARRRGRNLFLTTLDIRNAYGSVNHSAIHRSLKLVGAPIYLRHYVKDLYDSFRTNLVIGADKAPTVVVERGVLQGDPLSPVLFNLLIDQALNLIPVEVGVELAPGATVNGQAFADDLFIASETERGLQRSLDSICSPLRTWGLVFNVKKSSTLSLVRVAGHKSRLEVTSSHRFVMGDEEIPQIGTADVWKYLGAYFDHKGLVDAQSDLPKWLERVRKSPLKPQQKLFVLRHHVIPKLIYRLTFSKLEVNKLDSIDKVIRQAACKYVNLPKTTAVAFYYAAVKNGGLGLIRLRHSIPYMQGMRFLSTLQSFSPVVAQAALLEPNVKRIMKAERLLKRRDGIIADSAEEAAKLNADLLYGTIEGKGLRDAPQVGYAHSWVSDGTTFLKGKTYCDALKLRTNRLPTRSVTERSDEEARYCRAGCNQVETNQHVIQTCERSHGARIVRHDRVVQCISSELRKKGYTTEVEPILETDGGNRKPDILAVRDGVVNVIDPTITHDYMQPAFDFKVDKYSTLNPQVEERILEKYPGHTVEYAGFVVSYRGIVHYESEQFLRKNLGVSKDCIRMCAKLVIEGSVRCFNSFEKSLKNKNAHKAWARTRLVA